MNRREMLGVAALAAAALLLETTLTRLLAVAQFYHFAFLVVSLALLGFGASGTLLSLLPGLQAVPVGRILTWSGTSFAVSVGLAYAAVNWLPFDSYSLAWDRRQLVYFLLFYLALTLPFLCAGLGIGAALTNAEGRSHLVYAANLAGSAGGVLLALLFLELTGVPGAILASALVGLLPSATVKSRSLGGAESRVLGGEAGASGPRRGASAGLLPRLVLVAGLLGISALATLNFMDRAPLAMTISPYKGLSHARRYPGATEVFSRWSAISRADVVANAGTHFLPGLSYVYGGLPPPEDGLSLDADSLQPIPLVGPEAFDAAAYMPEAIAFQLRPGARALISEPAGGLGVLQALAGGASQVTAVVGDPLVRRAVAHTNPGAESRVVGGAESGAFRGDVYDNPRVRIILDTGRRYLQRDRETYDVVFIPLTDAYRPVTSGAYSLAESYSLTVEAFEDALARLAPDGILVVTRWVQMPPSEDLRLIATLAEALARRGVTRPDQALVAYRGIQTITALVKPGGQSDTGEVSGDWKPEELARLREFLASRRYDLVWAPDVRPDEVNRFNRTPKPEHFQAVQEFFNAFPGDLGRFYASYPFAVTPPTDDRPFFFHFFRWSQTPQVLATLGRTWQPFGGSGYFVLLALLALVLLLSTVLIIAPLMLRGGVKGSTTAKDRPYPLAPPRGPGRAALRLRIFSYFGLLGLAFLFVEIPLIQRQILLFGHPTYAFTGVVLTILLFSSLGSALARSPRLRKPAAFGLVIGILATLICVTALVTSHVDRVVMGWPLVLRALVAGAALAPVAFLMGLPFPFGLAWLEDTAPDLIPWAWAVNGCSSVVAAVLAAILALSYGFTVVLLLGAGAYAVAGALIYLELKRAVNVPLQSAARR